MPSNIDFFEYLPIFDDLGLQNAPKIKGEAFLIKWLQKSQKVVEDALKKNLRRVLDASFFEGGFGRDLGIVLGGFGEDLCRMLRAADYMLDSYFVPCWDKL